MSDEVNTDPWEPNHKEEWLIAQGRLWPDGSRKVVCPVCLREMAQGEQLPGENDAVATAGAVTADTAASVVAADTETSEV